LARGLTPARSVVRLAFDLAAVHFFAIQCEHPNEWFGARHLNDHARARVARNVDNSATMGALIVALTLPH
jgi:hypothetical protein